MSTALGWLLVAVLVRVGCARASPEPERPAPEIAIVPNVSAPDPLAQVAQLAGLLEAGIDMPAALQQVSGGDEWFDAAARAYQLGEPIPSPAADQLELRRLALTLTVVARTGGPAAEALSAVAVALADERDGQAAVRAALAAPVATARLLVALPLLGLALGYLTGSDPVAVLLSPGIGWTALAVGVAGNLSGWWWSRRLIRSATPVREVGR